MMFIQLLLTDEQNNDWSFVADRIIADEVSHPNSFSIEAEKQMAPTWLYGEVCAPLSKAI
jgi:hypothetical protein